MNRTYAVCQLGLACGMVLFSMQEGKDGKFGQTAKRVSCEPPGE
jgi:hypothetical protein